jgi:hypothetical protein
MLENKLTSRQKKGIICLMGQPTLERAAEAAGVHSSTIRRWIQDSADFRQALAQAEAQAISEAAASIAAGTREAIEHFRELLADEAQEPRRRDYAASQLLKHAQQIRITARLEEQVAELTQQTVSVNWSATKTSGGYRDPREHSLATRKLY